MKDYQAVLKRHLADYGRRQLGLSEPGLWRGRPYDHVLPFAQSELNFLLGCRSELLAHLDANRARITRHLYSHHLSSSQTFAFNLFFPFLRAGLPAPRSFFAAFGPLSPDDWQFEAVPCPREGTNVDVVWTDSRGGTLHCEVKLSEARFSPAKDDERHRHKLETIYRPWLRELVPETLLEPATFFPHYQILRNIALLHGNPRNRVAFLIPRENEGLARQLNRVLKDVLPATLERINVVYIEDLLTILSADETLPPPLRKHATAVAAKYLPVPPG